MGKRKLPAGDDRLITFGKPDEKAVANAKKDKEKSDAELKAVKEALKKKKKK